jgi:hypothetical protein
MATKGRNKPRVRGTKKMVDNIKSAGKKILRDSAPAAIARGARSGFNKIKEVVDNEKKLKKSSSAPSASLRPKPRPKATSLRPKVRPTKKSAGGGSLKAVPEGNKGLKNLPTAVRNKMGYMKKGGSCRGMGKATRGGSYGRMG